MPTESSIKQAQGLLAELANKQLFLNSLKGKNEKDIISITVTVQTVTSIIAPSKEHSEYWNVINSLINCTQADINILRDKINILLQ